MTLRPVLLGGLPAATVAAEYGTPLYVYDAALIRQRYAELVAGIDYDPLSVYYSCKANAAVGIVRLLVALGAKVDACSPGDIAVAQRAGCAGDDVSYVGVGVSDNDLDAVVASGAFFIADSLPQIDRYADRVPDGTAEIGLRLNCNVSADAEAHFMAGAWDSKFGIHLQQIGEGLQRAHARGLRVVGVHAHIGSGVRRSEPHLTALRRLLDAGSDITDLRFVSLGGGWGVSTAERDHGYPMAEFGRAAREILVDAERRTGRRIELRVEPGEFLVMDSGVLLTTITDIKEAVDLGGRRTPKFVCVDSSYNHVISAVVHNVYHPIEIAHDRDAAAEPDGICHVVGNLMQAGDIIAHDRPLPRIAVGDVIVVRRCGGYSSSRSTTFNERPRPAEVLVDGTVTSLLRRAETVNDLISREI